MVNKAEVDVFLELSCFSDDPADVGSLLLFHICRFFFFLIMLHDLWDFIIIAPQPGMELMPHSVEA